MRWLNGLSRAVSLLAICSIAACGGGGGGGGSNGPHGPTGPNEPVGTIQGIAQDGPLNDATVTAYAWNGSKGAVLGAGRTNFLGQYALTIRAPSQPVLIEVKGGFYVEEANPKQISLKDGQVVLGLINYRSGQDQAAMVTFYTTLAAGLAERLVGSGTVTSDAVVVANQRISGLLGIDITNVPPSSIDGSDFSPGVTPGLAYGFATAAVSSLADFVAGTSGSVSGSTSIELIQLAYDDIRVDGQLDGRGANGDLFLGTLPLTADIYRHELALHVLRIADNPLANKSQIKGPDLVSLAKTLNDSTDGVFGNVPVVALDSGAPNIAGASVVDKAVLFGKTPIAVTVASVAGISRVDARLIDGSQRVVIGPVAAPDPKKPTIVLDTTVVPDGAYQLMLSATDTAGASAQKTFAVSVANNQAVIENLSLPSDRPVSGTQIITATINDPVGVAKVEYIIDTLPDASFPTGDFPDPRTPYTLNTKRFGDGQKTLTIKLTNQQGGVFSKDFTFSTDNTVPTLSNVVPAAGVFVKQGFVVNGTAADNIGVASVEVLVNGNSVITRPALPFSVPNLNGDGVKNLTLRVRDVAGNITDVTRQITFDATPPTAMIVSPVGVSVVNGQITVTGVGMDNLGLATLRLGFVEVERNVELNCFSNIQPDGTLSGSLSFFTNTAASTNGDYRFTLFARDKAGNEVASAPIVLTFNNNPGLGRPNDFDPNGPQCFIAP